MAKVLTRAELADKELDWLSFEEGMWARLDAAERLLVDAKGQLVGNSVNHRTLREAIERFLGEEV